MTWCWLMFMALDLNRRNINRAISDDMLPELGMTTNDFNTGQTIFLLSFLAAELPSGLLSKKLGPDRFIPFIITAWSIISAAQAGLKNKAGYYACRCLLGLLMGGFIPDTVSHPGEHQSAVLTVIRLCISLTGISLGSYQFDYLGEDLFISND